MARDGLIACCAVEGAVIGEGETLHVGDKGAVAQAQPANVGDRTGDLVDPDQAIIAAVVVGHRVHLTVIRVDGDVVDVVQVDGRTALDRHIVETRAEGIRDVRPSGLIDLNQQVELELWSPPDEWTRR